MRLLYPRDSPFGVTSALLKITILVSATVIAVQAAAVQIRDPLTENVEAIKLQKRDTLHLSLGQLPLEKRGQLPLEKRGQLPLEKRGQLLLEKRGQLPLEKRGQLPLEKRGQLPLEKRDIPVPDSFVAVEGENRLERRSPTPTKKKHKKKKKKKYKKKGWGC
ncbi:hypothetical protein WDU94_010230 [Cyamophila willieti]